MQNVSMIVNGDLECAEVGVAYFKALLQHLPARIDAKNDTFLVEIQT
jgi:hypothetical protein